MESHAQSSALASDPSYQTVSSTSLSWWRGAATYQIYPRSYFDSNGDGIGDIPGITQKLDHIASLGVDAIWLSPFFTSPMKDYGYDVSNFCDVDPIFGTLADFDAMILRAHSLNLKVIIDQVYSHSSDQHEWFQESRSSRDNPKADWYVWVDPKPDGSPPNNWQSVFSGSAWQWEPRRGQYYLHNFLPEQPDLNLHNPDVQDAIIAVPEFWLNRGVDGFRLDALNFGFHSKGLEDNPPATRFKRPPTRPHDYQAHVHNMSQPEIYPFLERIRSVTDAFEDSFTVAEIGGPFPLEEMKTYTRGSDRLNTAYAFDFLYASELNANMIRETLGQWPDGDEEGWPSWAFSNHDAPRSVSRWRGDCPRNDYAKLLILLMISMRGNIFIYQGEELGLPQSEIAFDDLKDPEAIANWPETLGRDGARTPIPWEQSKTNAGFSSAKPWLPINDAHQEASVDTQINDPASVLSFYRDALSIRRDSETLKRGNLKFLASNNELLVIERVSGSDKLVTIVNLTDHPIEHPAVDGTILLKTNSFEQRTIPPYSGAIIST